MNKNTFRSLVNTTLISGGIIVMMIAGLSAGYKALAEQKGFETYNITTKKNKNMLLGGAAATFTGLALSRRNRKEH